MPWSPTEKFPSPFARIDQDHSKEASNFKVGGGGWRPGMMRCQWRPSVIPVSAQRTRLAALCIAFSCLMSFFGCSILFVSREFLWVYRLCPACMDHVFKLTIRDM